MIIKLNEQLSEVKREKLRPKYEYEDKLKQKDQVSITAHAKERKDVCTQKDKCEKELGKAKTDIQRKTTNDSKNSRRKEDLGRSTANSKGNQSGTGAKNTASRRQKYRNNTKENRTSKKQQKARIRRKKYNRRTVQRNGSVQSARAREKYTGTINRTD